jgi:hypothetical protein
VDLLYKQATDKLSRIAQRTGHNEDEPFSFDDYPAAKKQAEKVYRELYSGLCSLITTGEEEAWSLSYDKNSSWVDRITRNSGLTAEQIDTFKPRNMEALTAFQDRKINGMKLSEYVWNIVDNGKPEFELALDVALGDGRSAAMLSRDIRKFLKEPEKLFRRVRDKEGNLRLSERAKNYHPGQGVYRSSYKNAMRLSRTEINMAYHTADYETWKDNKLVLGYEIILSNNHIPDICDELAGKYPTDFKFVGWHPQCRCVAVPITPSKEEFLSYAKKKLDGEDVSDYEFEPVEFDGPAKLENWAEENRERAKNWANMPYFVTDNPKYVPLIEDTTDLKNYSQAMQDNFRVMETALGVNRGSSMTFEEANEMRGNPHYGESEAYRINCQTCVVANELRRRGFPVEALPNLKGSALEKLSHATEKAWLDGNGDVPNKIYVGLHMDWKFNEATSSPGRYHVNWDWKNRKKGHIVTFERFADGTGQWYDPQNGAIDFMTKEYTSKIRRVYVLRVDNLTANPEVCGKVLTKASGKAVSGAASKAGGMGAVATDEFRGMTKLIQDYYKAETNREKVEILQTIISSKSFKRLNYHSTAKNSIFGVNMGDFDKLLKKNEMPKNLTIAKKLLANKMDVYLMPNPNSGKSADYVVARNGKIFCLEGKTLNGASSLDHLLSKGSKQSERIVVDILGTNDTNYIANEVKDAFMQSSLLNEVFLLKGTRLIKVDRRIVSSKNFRSDFRKLWEKSK